MSLSEATVPVLLHYLSRLDGLLALAERHVGQGGQARVPQERLLRARLAEDMFSFAEQVRSACGFALRAVHPLAGRELPALGEPPPTLAGLRVLAQETAQALRALPRQAIEGADGVVRDEAGTASLALPAAEYALRYAMPNFFFHLSMAYAVLRALGLPVGKPDFDGYHAYPPGFRFPPPGEGAGAPEGG
ncbi:DUF1993 family protein [Luteimonas aquatica]|uniref:DUF1993 family protein n=1 Tax=Luteimonas aquatica TaxID=450364 RepID=UPI001F5A04FB|nr:DUF1993 domain-containing protein [Luteimonas aquatica]